MEVTDELIENLAHLARLEIKETEKASLKKDLERMIAFVEKLNEVNTAGVKPLLHISSEMNILRDDEVKQTITRKEALQNAPVKDEQFFKVPKVIKKE
ncbi:MAG: Asp-tRNA(Asn)/Glu-tRNA(Gln) amidotransferase subunit GatC [Chitinophagaceae bacterium]